MKRSQADVTEAELALLQALWDTGRRRSGSLWSGFTGRMGPSVYATVQKLLDRLEAKGCVRRDRSGPVHVFAAAIGRDELIGRRLRAVADALCGGSLTPLLTQLVRGQGAVREGTQGAASPDRSARSQAAATGESSVLIVRQSERINHGAMETLLNLGLANALAATVLAIWSSRA